MDVEHAYKGHGKYDLDRVYKSGDKYIVVEAKGGSAELGTRELANGQRAQQGTRQYLEATIDSMSKSTKPEARKIAGELEQALQEGKVEYYKATTKIGSAAKKPVVKPTTLERFSL